MFDKLKQLQQLKGLQDELGKEKLEIEKNGIKIIVNGKMEIENIKLNPKLSDEDQETMLADCINEAIKKVQATAMQKVFQSGKFNF